MGSDDEELPPSISKKKQKHVKKLLENTVFVSVKSNLEDIQVSYMFLNKKDLVKKLVVFSIIHNFQFRVHRLNKKLYVLRCSDSACSWQLMTIKLDLHMFKVFKYESMHTCQKVLRKQDPKQAKS